MWKYPPGRRPGEDDWKALPRVHIGPYVLTSLELRPGIDFCNLTIFFQFFTAISGRIENGNMA